MSRKQGEVPVHLDALEPGTRVGRWRVVERLGVGGQGVVYRVEDLEHPGDFYALKLALSPRDARAEREAELQWAIVHVRPVAPVLVNPRVPRALSDVIVRLLSKEPRERYAKGEALHAALVAAVSGKEAGWDAALFEWEEVPPAREGEPAERQLVRPPRPRPSWSAPPSSPLREARRKSWLGRLVLVAAGGVLFRASITEGGGMRSEAVSYRRR